MMSIGQVRSAGSAANYYTDKDNYYVLGSLEDRWAGKGAAALGLEGAVDKKIFTQVLAGKLPDGADLSREQNGGNRHRPGYDLTFSAPKSVSVMAMLGGDKRLLDAHNRAVSEAVRQVEGLASTRVMENGQRETVMTGNLVMALFNHDTSRDQEPQLHTHAVVANVTQHEGEWKTLSSDRVGKTGFIENVYANQIAFGKIYRAVLKEQVEALGYETQVVGRHGMWEMPGVPVEVFSSRSKAIREAVGEDASLKSRDVAALDTRRPKEKVDPEVKLASWMQTLKDTGFDVRAYRDAADARAAEPLQRPENVAAPDVSAAVSQAIAGLSERKVQFTWTDLLSRTVGQLPAVPGVFEQAREGIEAALAREQIIPLDREKGLFTSGIHLLDELSVRALGKEVLAQGRVSVFPEKSQPRTAAFSDAVSVLAQDRPALAIISGQGGAAGQRERVAELTMMAKEQGRPVMIIAADTRSAANLVQAPALAGEHITGRKGLREGMTFTPGSTVVVDQGEKLSLKETLTLLDGAVRHNVQVLISDSGQRTGTGSALTALQDAGVTPYRWLGGEQTPVRLVSEPDRLARYAQLAADYTASVSAGERSVVQVSGVREQAVLSDMIRTEMKSAGLLGEQDTTLTALSPVWLDSRSRMVRDTYREGMVLEKWDPARRENTRFVIDRVTDRTHSLTLRDVQGETQQLRLSELDSSWMLYRAESLKVADGERLVLTARLSEHKVPAGKSLTVTGVADGRLTLKADDRQRPLTLSAGQSLFTAPKLTQGWVESPGHSVSDSATVFAAITHNALDAGTLNSIARSGKSVTLYSSVNEAQATERLARLPVFSVVSGQVKARAGEASLNAAIKQQMNRLHSPAQQAIHLALPVLEARGLAFSQAALLAEAGEFGSPGVTLDALKAEVSEQIVRGDLLHVDVAKGHGADLLVSRASFDAEKSILRHILEGKEAVTPLMERVPGHILEGLTSGQRAATHMILGSRDRFTVVQGYAGVGKTTQFRAVMSAINALPEAERPQVVGLGPTHRAVGEMRSAGVDARTLASFLHDAQVQARDGEVPDYRNTLFLLDESSMVGNTDMARAYALIASGGGRAVASGDSDQLQAISPGQPFRLQQTRSAADVAIMKEIVRQSPALRPAALQMINRDIAGALQTLEQVSPSQVPRQPGAWVPPQSVVAFSREDEKAWAKAAEQAEQAGEAPPASPSSLYEAVVQDYTGRTPEAQAQTLVITGLNADRRALNSLIHQAREQAGELSGESKTLPVLVTANIRDGELRRLATWEQHRNAVALVDRVYWQIAGIDAKDELVTLRDAQGNTRLISPREASAEAVTLYQSEQIQVAAGDRMRFTKSDNERGYVANSVWTVQSVKGDAVTLSDGSRTRTLHPGRAQEEQHIDLAYAITTHGSQGASEPFSILMTGVEGARARMASFESAYVGLTRMKQHAQVYTDDRDGWVSAVQKTEKRATVHDVLAPRGERETMNAERLFSTARPLYDVAAGRALLHQAGIAGGDSPARFIAPGKKYPQPHVALPAFDRNGKPAGIWLNPVTTDAGNALRGFSGKGRIMGSDEARFVALQNSRNGETVFAPDMPSGIRAAGENPDRGVVVSLGGDERPWNPGSLTGGRVWADIPGEGVMPGGNNGEPETAAVAAQRRAEEEALREMERRAEDTVRAMMKGEKQPDDNAERAVRAVARDEQQKSRDEGVALPSSLVDRPAREQEAVREVAREQSAQVRLHQQERDIVRDIHKDITPGGD
ncbi:conjugative transfer relaxase/helicase TraI [Pectobacterium aroidearum]|uniref:conjugative transfer relaxase/helicase TraI n=1 Tax=Pectobacterium aroidearum TaxID=1201031 RepID=UPI003017E103